MQRGMILAEIATREKKVLILAVAEILGYHMCPLGFTDVFFSYLCVCVNGSLRV